MGSTAWTPLVRQPPTELVELDSDQPLLQALITPLGMQSDLVEVVDIFWIDTMHDVLLELVGTKRVSIQKFFEVAQEILGRSCPIEPKDLKLHRTPIKKKSGKRHS